MKWGMRATQFPDGFHEPEVDFLDEDGEQIASPIVPSDPTIYITTDNASNISKAVMESDYEHIRCFAHTINLAVQKGLLVVDNQLSRLRKIVSTFHRSTKAKNLLQVT